jgi:hypothetical protein
MKYILVLSVVVVLGVLVAHVLPNKEEYRATITEVVTQEVEKEVDALSKRIADAQSASSTEIETQSKKAYEDKKNLMLKEIELKVRKQYEAELEAERVQLEKEVGTY